MTLKIKGVHCLSSSDGCEREIWKIRECGVYVQVFLLLYPLSSGWVLLSQFSKTYLLDHLIYNIPEEISSVWICSCSITKCKSLNCLLCLFVSLISSCPFLLKWDLMNLLLAKQDEICIRSLSNYWNLGFLLDLLISFELLILRNCFLSSVHTFLGHVVTFLHI